ncbi:MAG: cation-efflux pump [Actinomycetota bacterium]|nr:cation-efflux pump [Actinomycetota bacterium]
MTPTRHDPQRTALLALGITCLLTLAKLAVWISTSSLAVLSQALDSALDIVALGLVFFGVRIAAKPADDSHHYGHGKAENLVAFTQTLFLAAVVVGVAFEAVARLRRPSEPIEVPWFALALLATSALVDVVRVVWLLRAARREGSDALGAGALNIATDVGTAAVALVSLVAVRAGIEDADAIGGLVVAAAVAVAATRLGRRSVDVLMDRAPGGPVRAIEDAAGSAPGVAEARRVRVRASGQQLFADVTVAAARTASLERAHDIAERVEREIEAVAPGADVVVHVEPASETSGLVERVQAAASRVDGVHEVHNVLVHAFDENGKTRLQVSLHAKVGRGVSLADAHDLSEEIEETVSREIGPDARVDTHIEPLESTTLGKDVTEDRGDIVDDVIEAALQETDVQDCHEVLVTSAGEGLSIVAHVRGRRDLPLERIHDASERIENRIRSAHVEVGSVLIHFEPV